MPFHLFFVFFIYINIYVIIRALSIAGGGMHHIRHHCYSLISSFIYSVSCTLNKSNHLLIWLEMQYSWNLVYCLNFEGVCYRLVERKTNHPLVGWSRLGFISNRLADQVRRIAHSVSLQSINHIHSLSLNRCSLFTSHNKKTCTYLETSAKKKIIVSSVAINYLISSQWLYKEKVVLFFFFFFIII